MEFVKNLQSFLQSCNKSLINQACSGPYHENIGPRSFLYGPRCARSVLSRPRADILPVRPSRLVNKMYVQPYFEYCSPLWDNCGKLLKDKLQRFQSRAARLLIGVNYDIRSAEIIQTLSWDILDARRLRAKSTLMYKILNDDTAPNLKNSFVRRNAVQTDYHLRNSATDLTLPKPERDFLKKVLNIAAQCFGTNSRMKQN